MLTKMTSATADDRDAQRGDIRKPTGKASSIGISARTDDMQSMTSSTSASIGNSHDHGHRQSFTHGQGRGHNLELTDDSASHLTTTSPLPLPIHVNEPSNHFSRGTFHSPRSTTTASRLSLGSSADSTFAGTAHSGSTGRTGRTGRTGLTGRTGHTARTGQTEPTARTSRSGEARLATQSSTASSLKLVQFSQSRLQSNISQTYFERHKEQRTIDRAVQQLLDPARESNIIKTCIPLSGLSGSGKSTLATSYVQEQARRHASPNPAIDPARARARARGHIYAFCKFQTTYAEPYSGIRAICVDICHQLSSMNAQSFAQDATADFATDARAANGTGTGTEVEPPEGSPQNVLKDVRQAMMAELDATEVAGLCKFIPNLVDVIGADSMHAAMRGHYHNDTAGPSQTGVDDDGAGFSATPSASQRSNVMLTSAIVNGGSGDNGGDLPETGYKEMSDRFRFALRSFLSIVCRFVPVIMVCDDIQWADTASLDLLLLWMSDTTIVALLLMICYRSNHAQDASISKTLNVLEDCRRDRSVRVIPIAISNLSPDQVNNLLQLWLNQEKAHSTAVMLSPTSSPGQSSEATTAAAAVAAAAAESTQAENPFEATVSLANIVHRKTDGNIFFIQQLLFLLISQDLLAYNVGMHRWIWNDQDIREQMPATINVVDIMKQKLNDLTGVQHILPMLSCLGTTFTTSLAKTILQGFQNDDDHQSFYTTIYKQPVPSFEDCLKILKLCEDQGLLEVISSRHFGEVTDAVVTTNTDMGGNGGNTSATGPTQHAVNQTADENGDIVYAFVHDRVQETAHELLEEVHGEEMKFRMGTILLRAATSTHADSASKITQHQHQPEEEEVQHLFLLLNLINTNLDLLTDQAERHRIALLNRHAGIKSISYSAFASALEFFENALHLLPDEGAVSHADSSGNVGTVNARNANARGDANDDMRVELYSSLTECAFISSAIEKAKEHGSYVISQPGIGMMQKIRVQHIFMDIQLAEAAHDRAVDATSLGLSVLREFGCKFPKRSLSRTISLLRGLMKYKSMAKTWTMETFDAIPLADETECAVSKTLDKLVTASYLTLPELMPLAVLKGVDRAFEHGISTYTPPSLLLLGLLLGFVLGEFETGSKCANLALSMLPRLKNRGSQARTTFMCHGSVLNWTMPFRQCIPQLIKAHSIGMATGDVESGCWAMYFNLDMCYLAGSSLISMEEDIATYTKMALDFEQSKMHDSMCMLWQLVANLRGLSENQTLLIGDIFDERQALEKYAEQKDVYMEAFVKRNKVYAAVTYGDFRLAADLCIDVYQAVMTNHAGQAGCMYMTFCAALSCFAAISKQDAKRSQQGKKYRTLGKQCMKKLEEWVRKKGNPNCVHYLSMVEGERMAAKGERMKADRFFRDAIRLAGRRGLIQDQALANERLAERWIAWGDKDTAKFHFDEATVLYREWGADGKVVQLDTRCSEIWKPPMEINVNAEHSSSS